MSFIEEYYLDSEQSSSLHLHEKLFRNYLKMHVPIDMLYLRFKKLALSYLNANDIVYRIKS